MADPSAHYWLYINQQACGPYPLDAVKAMLKDGSLSWKSFVCPVGQEQWIPLNTLPEFTAVDDDYYQILGVDSAASFETIRRAFRKRSMERHPDRGGTHAEMVLIAKAWEILSNPEKRSRYDQLRLNPDDLILHEAAAADTHEAEHRAAQYPRQWETFENWLNHAAGDVASARYGETFLGGPGGWSLPTVQESTSGLVFLVVGALAGVGVALWLLSTGPLLQGNVGRFLFACVAFGGIGGLLGARVGVGMHAYLQELVEQGTSTTRNSDGEVTVCQDCGQKLRLPCRAGTLVITCPSCKSRKEVVLGAGNQRHSSHYLDLRKQAKTQALWIMAIVVGILGVRGCGKLMVDGIADNIKKDLQRRK